MGVYPDQPEAGLCRYQGGAELAPATTARIVNIQMGWRVDQARPASWAAGEAASEAGVANWAGRCSLKLDQ